MKIFCQIGKIIVAFFLYCECVVWLYMERLTERIRKQGVQDPIIVRLWDTGEYEVISIEKRFSPSEKAFTHKMKMDNRRLQWH